MIRTAEDVLRVVKERGMRVKIDQGPPVMPMLVVPKGTHPTLPSETLLNALRQWRLEIIEIVSKEATDGKRQLPLL
jgi:hypothetical protein